ncbi:MAG TPA: sugar-transfer associated ATP-grasp domain-containing protein [Hyphomicrobiaceae bacterium]|nr:sugar-transfer associated ATP-grasp domain-containing protein [Hyphomicrobiaceae bacterium]
MSASALRRDPEPAPPVAAEEPAQRPVFDTDVVEPGLDLATTLRVITTRHGKPYQRLLLDLAKASFGPGRLSYDEFIGLRLFDDAWVAGADITRFVGLDAERRMWMAANSNSEWWGLMRNKLAVTTLLGGYGFPVIPTLALYSDAISMRGFPIFRDPGALARFLRASHDYPLFGKPMDSQRSLGSIGLDAYVPRTDCLMAGARSIPVADFAAAVAEHYKGGYIFQRRVSPHAAVSAAVGDRLATVRAITILTEEGPQLLRALWKVPVGSNVADNFWRTGNLLATLDLESGRVLRVVRGTGLALEEVTHHPDTGAQIVGFEVPNWNQIVSLAKEAASTLPEVPLIGWDMAAVEGGALIVEPNFTPDFFMTQLADRRGMLDAPFTAFLEARKAAAKQVKRGRRIAQTAEGRERMRRLGRDMTGG